VIRALSLAASFEALAGTLPRTRLAVLPTPLVAAPRLAAALGTGVPDRDSVDTALPAAELRAQLDGDDVTVVVPTGSGGTLAGLVAGHVLLGRPWTLLGCSASRPPQAAQRQVLTLARECLRLLGAEQEPGPADVTVVDARGPGHGLPSPDGLVAAEQAMRTED